MLVLNDTIFITKEIAIKSIYVQLMFLGSILKCSEISAQCFLVLGAKTELFNLWFDLLRP